MEIKLDELIPVFNTENVSEEVEDTKVEDTTSEEEIKTDDSAEEQEEIIEEEKSTSDEETEVEASKSATIFYKELASHGIGKDEKDEYTFDDVQELITNYTTELPKQITNEIIESTPDIGKKAIDYIFTKGEQLTKESLKEFVDTYLNDLESSDVTVSNEEEAREFLSKVYKDKGFKESVVEVMLDTLEDEGDLLPEAKKELESIPKKADEILTQTKQEQLAFEEQQKQFVESINSEFESLGWDKRRVSKLKNDLFEGKTSQILQEAAKHPKALIQLTDFADYWDNKTKSFDFTKFIEKVSSKDAKSLKDRIEQDMFNSTPKTKETGAIKKSNLLDDDLVPIV